MKTYWSNNTHAILIKHTDQYKIVFNKNTVHLDLTGYHTKDDYSRMSDIVNNIERINKIEKESTFVIENLVANTTSFSMCWNDGKFLLSIDFDIVD